MKKFSKLFCTLIAFLVLFVGVAGCNSNTNEDNTPTGGEVEAPVVEELSYVSMRINPEIELVVDEEGIVVAVNAVNEDGETVLCQLELTGLTVEAAGEKFTEMSIELGFIDVDTEEAHVYLTINGENVEFITEIQEKVSKKINEVFDKLGVYGKACIEKLEEIEELQAFADEWEIDIHEAQMVLRISELYPEMAIEDIIALDFIEMMELIKDEKEHHGMPINLKDEYNAAVELLNEEFTQLFELKGELRELQFKLMDPTLTEEEKATLEAEYALKKVEHDTLEALYKAAVEEIQLNVNEEIESAREHYRKRAQERRNQYADKLTEHLNRVQEEIDKIKDLIDSWRNEETE